MTARLALVVLALLVLASPALGSEEQPTLAELESEVYCPTCQTPLALSSSAIAERMRAFIRQWIAEGDTKSEIKAKLVSQFGERVLAAPPKKGFNLLAWVLPLAGIGIAGTVVGLLAWRWTASSRRRASEADESAQSAGGALDPELERRLDEELARFEP